MVLLCALSVTADLWALMIVLHAEVGHSYTENGPSMETSRLYEDCIFYFYISNYHAGHVIFPSRQVSPIQNGGGGLVRHGEDQFAIDCLAFDLVHRVEDVVRTELVNLLPLMRGADGNDGRASGNGRLDA